MQIETVQSFGAIIAGILRTDRWVFIGCDGDMGEGKSCFTSKLAKAIGKIVQTPFSYEHNMTYSRKEVKKWVDGEGEAKKGQKPELSVILADEIISMFFKRNWYDSSQIDGIELLNKCRDRHLCIIGNLPNFWDLDSAIFPILTFWVHIHERGRAWVFRKDNNPFTTDKWHRRDNEKLFRKKKNPYSSENFVCEIHFDNWSDADKEHYYEVRNRKRVNTEGQKEKVERYSKIKKQRDVMIRFILNEKELMTNRALAELTDMGEEHICMIKNNNA